MDLRHYTKEPLLFDRNKTYQQYDGEYKSPYTKPRGFWVSVQGEQDWPSWCRDEGFAEDSLTHESEVTLVDDANVLFVPNYQRLKLFEITYSKSETHTFSGYSYTDRHIDWPRVTNEYAGIIIAPHQWEGHLDMKWYNGWDVASGCIWDLSSIKEVKELVNG